jgi:hypothetical protein
MFSNDYGAKWRDHRNGISEGHPIIIIIIIIQNYFVLHREHNLVSITKTKQHVLLTEMMAVCCDNRARKINALWAERAILNVNAACTCAQ